MTRKDYELIAAAIWRSKVVYVGQKKRTRDCEDQRATTAKNVAEALADDNPSFDKERFLYACGVDDEVNL